VQLYIQHFLFLFIFSMCDNSRVSLRSPWIKFPTMINFGKNIKLMPW
jgi:hypothetical protein